MPERWALEQNKLSTSISNKKEDQIEGKHNLALENLIDLFTECRKQLEIEYFFSEK